MRPALKLLQRGFLKRSIDEIRTQAHGILSMQGVTGKFDDLEIHSFRHPSSLENIKTFSDADMGGFSKVNMDLEPFPTEVGEEKKYYGRFHGNISIELPQDRPMIQRSGYAAWRTTQRGRTLFGQPFWNVDPYTFLALRIKSGGSKYFINIQTDSIVETDLHQHRLFAKNPGQWEVIHVYSSSYPISVGLDLYALEIGEGWADFSGKIPIGDFVRTNHGRVTEPQGEILRQKVKTVGIGLIDRVPGPFELCIDRIWVTNNAASVPMPKPRPEVHSVLPRMITGSN